MLEILQREVCYSNNFVTNVTPIILLGKLHRELCYTKNNCLKFYTDNRVSKVTITIILEILKTKLC